MRILSLAIVFALFYSQVSLAQIPEEVVSVDIACAPEAEQAKCGTKTTGKGLMACIKKHKNKTSDFKISKPCKKAMLKLQRAAKAKKHERSKKQ